MGGFSQGIESHQRMEGRAAPAVLTPTVPAPRPSLAHPGWPHFPASISSVAAFTDPHSRAMPSPCPTPAETEDAGRERSSGSKMHKWGPLHCRAALWVLQCSME